MTELTTANRTTTDDAPTEPAATVRSVDDVVAEIDLPYTGKLPEAALREIQRRPAEFVPWLIELLRRAMNAVRAGEDYDHNGHFFALHLLTEFQAREAWPTILETLSLPKDGPYVLYDDVLYHTLPQILAEFLADDQAALDRLIDDDAVDEGVRWAATVALLPLVRDGRLSRDESVRRLRERLAVETASEEGDWKIATGLVLELAKYAPREALVEIRLAFERNLVDVARIRLVDVERNVADGDACLRKSLADCPPTGIADTVEELCQSGWFDDDESPSRTAAPATLDDDEFSGLPLDEPFHPDTIVNDGPRIGRNDPCPCGSGRKYKKCCGAG